MLDVDIEKESGHLLGRATSSDATYFAPAPRESDDSLYGQVEKARRSPFIRGLIFAIPDMAVLLNSKRQIIMANDVFCQAVNINCETVIGMRPGEALSCKNPSQGPSGCGTSQYCVYCGTVLAILKSQKFNSQFTDNCVIHTQEGDVLNLYISASEFSIEKESFTLLIAKQE